MILIKKAWVFFLIVLLYKYFSFPEEKFGNLIKYTMYKDQRDELNPSLKSSTRLYIPSVYEITI